MRKVEFNEKIIIMNLMSNHEMNERLEFDESSKSKLTRKFQKLESDNLKLKSNKKPSSWNNLEFNERDLNDRNCSKSRV